MPEKTLADVAASVKTLTVVTSAFGALGLVVGSALLAMIFSLQSTVGDLKGEIGELRGAIGSADKPGPVQNELQAIRKAVEALSQPNKKGSSEQLPQQ